MNYEEAINELKEITLLLEGDLPLSKSTAYFERASELARFCQEELSKNTGKLFEIKKDLDKISEEEV